MIKRKALESLKHEVIIEVNGKKVKISNVTSVKTVSQEWTLDEPSKYDPGSGTEETFINSVEVNDKIFLISEQGHNDLVENSKRSCKLIIMILYKFCTHMRHANFSFLNNFSNILLGKQNSVQKTRGRCHMRNKRVF